MSGPLLRIRDVGAYLGVSHQRAEQMFHEGKFPEPERFDNIGPQWKRATIERWGRA
jgi:predicted DNA-binding transcriptional regulator AlpA